MEPALTPEQWAAKKRPGSDLALIPAKEIALQEYSDEEGVWNNLSLRGGAGWVTVNRPDMPAVAAFALHGQPFGFTREDVAVVRWLADYVKGDLQTGYHVTRGDDIADRIEALLPPE